MASVESELQIAASRKTKLVADKLIIECANSVFDGIFLPGQLTACLPVLMRCCFTGGLAGSERLRDSNVLVSMLKEQGFFFASASDSHALLQI